MVEPDPELSPEEAEQARKDYLLTRFWISARGYWGRGGDRLAWVFSIGLLILIVANVGFQYGINVWNRAIFDAIEKRESATVFYLTAVFFPLAIGSVLLGVAQVFARMGIQRRWRAWLTSSVMTRWLANGRYYQLNLVGGDHKNPEYRIAEDLRIATDSPVDFVAGVTSAFLSAATFIVVLWTIGGALTVTIGGSVVTIPGFLVIAAVVYAAIASGSIMAIGRRFVQVSEDKNQAEAEYPLRADARARERREHRAARRRGGRTRRHRQEFHQCAAAMVAARPPAHAHHAGVAGIEPDRARGAAVAVRAEIPRRQHDARTGDAGGLRLHHRADRVRLAGRQLSAAGRLERLRAPHRLADDVARRAGARRARRRLRPHQARRDRGRGHAQPERFFGDARRRHRRGRRNRSRDRARRAAIGGRRIRHRQEHAGARDRGAVAMGRRQRQFPSRPPALHAAAEALHPVRHAAPRDRLSRRRRGLESPNRSAKPCTRSASIISRRRSRKTRRGTRRCRAAKSSGWRSRGCCCTTPTSWCWTRRPPRSTKRARTR